MKSFWLLLSLTAFTLTANAQAYWQQKVDTKISVSFDPENKTAVGQIDLTYFNNSPDTLHVIPFHIWMNAFKNDKSLFTKEDVYIGSTDYYFSKEEQKGYINRLNFTVNNTPATFVEDSTYNEVIHLILPAALPPGKSINIETPFNVRLPYNFSRPGYKQGFFAFTQWFPKPAVYDRNGWHTMPYLNLGEYYAEFGSYDVSIKAPAEYLLAASGKEIEKNLTDTSFSYRFVLDNATDFAWFASKDMAVDSSTLDENGRPISLYFYHPKGFSYPAGIDEMKTSILHKSKGVGPYPFDVAKVVVAPFNFGGGMEYPSITVVSPDTSFMQHLINHEIGHNWFLAALGSNERRYPYLDEGFNSYYDNEYMKLHRKPGSRLFSGKENFLTRKFPDEFESLLLRGLEHQKADQPINSHSAEFSLFNYGLIPYNKAAAWLKLLEEETGKPVFDNIMQEYYRQWKFRHPYPQDFKKIADSISGKNLDAHFAKLDQKGSLTPPTGKQVKATWLFNFKDTDKYHYIGISPVPAYNKYDGFMPGLLVHNYNIPLSRFRFAAVPMYGLKSGELNYIGNIAYQYLTDRFGENIKLSLGAAKFSRAEFTDSTGETHSLGFSKIAPAIRYYFPFKNARSTVTRSIYAKYYRITEQSVSFTMDTVTGATHIGYPENNTGIIEGGYQFRNFRVLYPYDGDFRFYHGTDFSRLQFTGNYFFNYANKGGLNIRAFAGKFFYHTNDQFRRFYTDRYQFSMTGSNGAEDFAYNSYFIGRNEFDNGLSRQIAIRDGGFKTRTDLLSNEVGKSGDWLASLNFTTTIPKKINPLSVLPFEVPVKIFAGLGSNGNLWKNNATGEKMLFEAGLQLSVFKDFINVYFPITYSKAYRDYAKSIYVNKIFQKNISFSIDVQKLNPSTLFPQFNF